MAPVTKHKYCFLDIDINKHREKLRLAAAFVHATDARYGFSSKDLRVLGGSELKRIEVEDLISYDHDFAPKVKEIGGYALSHDSKVDGGRIVVELYWDKCPLACENFMMLCGGGSSFSDGRRTSKGKPANVQIGVCGKPLTYVGSIIHRIVRGFVMQGGDFVMSNGSGGESIYGKKFKDEKAGLLLKHNERGILSMGNSGKNSNSSQFFITFGPTPQCNGKHVIFGKVVSGFEVLDAVEGVSSESVGEAMSAVTIINAGVYEPLNSPGQGYFFDQPDDSYARFSAHFMAKPRVAVIAPSDTVMTRFIEELSTSVSVTPIVDNGDGSSINTAQSLLESFSVDIIVIAPACKQSRPEIPSSWNELEDTQWQISKRKEAIIISKPVDCVKAIRKSWVYECNWYFQNDFSDSLQH